MPYIIYPDNFQRSPKTDFRNVSYGYEYPNGLDLKPGSKLHEAIKEQLLKRIYDSSGIMSKKHPSWQAIDRVLTSYVDLSTEEEKVKDEDDRKPVSIVFPYSFALLETMLAYLVAAFFQDPIFQYQWTTPEGMIGSILMEKVIAQQCYFTKVPLRLHTFFRDGLAYGFGVTAPDWVKEYGVIYERRPKKLFGITYDYEYDEVDGMTFEGNALNNIDPYLVFPDINTPIQDVQKSEFFGWLERTNYIQLLGKERRDENVFNVRYVNHITNKRSIFSNDHSDRELKQGGRSESYQDHVTPTDKIQMYIDLIPNEFPSDELKIGDGEYPEKWKFTLAADEVLIEARPAGFNHNRFPIAVCAPDSDGYATTPLSRLETLYGLQGLLDWMFNAHVANVRKAVNDTIIVDPYQLNMEDLKVPKPGGIVRLRRPAWGRGVKDTFAQLAITDVTRQHVQDASFFMGFMNMVGGVDESAGGMLRKGGPERLTKAEFQGTRSGMYSRLERMARIVGLQGMQDIGFFFGSHLQQLMSKESYITAIGRWQKTLALEYGEQNVLKNGGMIKVNPKDIKIPYHSRVRDGSVPGSNPAEAWIQLFKIMAESPELQQQFDMVRIFKHIARNIGAKNVDDFERIRVSKVPDEQIVREADKGNLVPMDKYMEGGNR